MNNPHIGGNVMDDIRAFEKEHPDAMAYAKWYRMNFKRAPKYAEQYRKGFMAGWKAAMTKRGGKAGI